MSSGFGALVAKEFEIHCTNLRNAQRARKEAMRFRNLIEDKDDKEVLTVEETLGKRQPQDVYNGDVNLRTLRALLKMVDERGWERSPHQVHFHEKFEQSVSRVLYKGEWAAQRPAIMKKNGWTRCASEVMISTPRRFGKTFSIAIFCACLSLTMGCEIVVFSPARRASRKLLERMVEFIRVLDCEEHIVEYNQEACRVVSFNGGKKSLIRSFPSRVGVSTASNLERAGRFGSTAQHRSLHCSWRHHKHTFPGQKRRRKTMSRPNQNVNTESGAVSRCIPNLSSMREDDCRSEATDDCCLRDAVEEAVEHRMCTLNDKVAALETQVETLRRSVDVFQSRLSRLAGEEEEAFSYAKCRKRIALEHCRES